MAGGTFKGDFRKLERLIHDFRTVGSQRFLRNLNRQLAEESLRLAHDGFERSISPYGKRWKNPKYRSGQPLRDTRRLEASIRPQATATTFQLSTSVIYAAPHLYGWPERNIPQRQFLPVTSLGFGGRWRLGLAKVFFDNLQAHFGG